MKEKTELSKRLRQVREELCGGRNGEFAEKLGVSPQYASAICTGHRAPKRETLERLLEVFPQVRRAWLLQGEGEMLSGSTTGWTTSMSSTPEELSAGSVTLPAEFLAMYRRQAESMLSKDEQISQLIELLEKKSPAWCGWELMTMGCTSASASTAKNERACHLGSYAGTQAHLNAKVLVLSVFKAAGRRLFKM